MTIKKHHLSVSPCPTLQTKQISVRLWAAAWSRDPVLLSSLRLFRYRQSRQDNEVPPASVHSARGDLLLCDHGMPGCVRLSKSSMLDNSPVNRLWSLSQNLSTEIQERRCPERISTATQQVLVRCDANGENLGGLGAKQCDNKAMKLTATCKARWQGLWNLSCMPGQNGATQTSIKGAV